MAGHPDQPHLLEASHAFPCPVDQNHQPGNPRTVRAERMADGDIAVALQQQMSSPCVEGKFERRAQRMQFGFVVAAGTTHRCRCFGTDAGG